MDYAKKCQALDLEEAHPLNNFQWELQKRANFSQVCTADHSLEIMSHWLNKDWVIWKEAREEDKSRTGLSLSLLLQTVVSTISNYVIAFSRLLFFLENFKSESFFAFLLFNTIYCLQNQRKHSLMWNQSVLLCDIIYAWQHLWLYNHLELL